MHHNMKICTALLTLLLLIIGVSSVNAQTLKDVTESSVGFKTRLEGASIDPFAYRGEPIHYGSFLIWPNLTLEQVYNDNVFATNTNQQGDFATIIKPEIIIKKDIGRHQFIGSLNADINQYYDETSENVENYALKLEADIEAKQGINIPLSLSYRDGHLSRQGQTRASANDIPKNPLANQNLEVESGIVIKPNRLSLALLGNYRQGRLENGELNNGTTLIRDTRNIDRKTGIIRLSYDYSETFTPFLDYEYSEENYINEAIGATTRNNKYNQIQAGSFFDYRGVITGALGLGWGSRTYDAPTIDDSNGLSIDGRISLNPTEKTQLGAQFSREQIEDNVIIAGLTRNFAKLNLTHEITRLFFTKASVSYEDKNFDNINREDQTYGLNIGFNYILSPRLQIGTEYQFITRDSTLKEIEMDNSILFLRAKFSL